MASVISISGLLLQILGRSLDKSIGRIISSHVRHTQKHFKVIDFKCNYVNKFIRF